ncbi:peptidase S9B dipeptidylpeptidase IV domain-containing protein [Rhodopirellula maiorica SM1]|uniref:Peptidase S9B dipeptidylpeptidase IV domain-containing protein n=2 Tax=Novipirellula TaxID=2795426 RepID=M5RJ80_9BACT|nr:peptidase S9B dipeptidylpeptidase IV domain-containing protein [Rhodopirellula maiorica SM1]
MLTLATFVIAPAAVFGQGSKQDYERWQTLKKRISQPIFADKVDPNWSESSEDSFWYQVLSPDNTFRYIIVDATTKTRREAFDHDQLANLLASELGEDAASSKPQLNLRSLSFDAGFTKVRFELGKRKWEFVLPSGPLSEVDSRQRGREDLDDAETLAANRQVHRSRDGGDRTEIQFENRTDEPLHYKWVTSTGEYRDYGRVAPKQTASLSTFAGHSWVLESPSGSIVAAFVADVWQSLARIDADTPRPKPLRSSMKRSSRAARSTRSRSPDDAWQVAFENHNVVLTSTKSDARAVLTTEGESTDGFAGRVWWSPDSRSFVVMKTKKVDVRTIPIVQASPAGSIHSKLHTIDYAKPGDAMDHPRPVLFRVNENEIAETTVTLIDDSLFPNPYSLGDLQWHEDSASFSFLYNERGHQTLRVISVDRESGEPRVMIDEQSDTFVCYSHKTFLQRIDATNEAIWMSERSGWNHLYLVDQTSGEVKNAITRGDWVVRGVEQVDEANRQIWLTVSGIDKGQDPYHRHLIRVNFDGSNLVRLTQGDGDHEWQFSPQRRYLVDSYSRVDLPTVTELRDAVTGELVVELEKADASELLKTGWEFPERFVAKGRDGETDIHGIIIRPTNFDASKKYPVLEAIYAGPHSAFVPKQFGRHSSLYEMAELGFIVVKIDGMGTSHRSKAFHDVCWQNLGDSGFPDRIAWMKAAAIDRPEMDLSRVGIWGGSAGGQSAMRALIAHGDFYHAAVADCGCHDNRVDKRWWNEQWMGYPIGPHYAEQSNVTQAHRLQGDLMLIVGEMDQNVDPATTMQVVGSLVQADKDFELLVMPGVGHGAASHPYAHRRQADFFIRKLWGNEPRF